MRKIMLLLLVSSLLFSMSSCKDYYHGLEYGKKDIVSPSEGNGIEYQGEKYYQLKENIFGTYNIKEKEIRDADLILLSWSYNFPFTGVITFFSYSTESPNFIVEPDVEDTVWFKESFDYQKEIFVVENTEIEVIFSSVFTDKKIKTTPGLYDPQSFYWHAKSYNSLRTKVEVFKLGDNYYMNIPNMSESYQISEPFLDSLIAHGVIITDQTAYPRTWLLLNDYILVQISVFCVDDHWCVGGNKKGMLFEISDEFVKLFTGNT